MGFPSVLSFAHKLIAERLQPGDNAIDATAGTGADTVFLAACCGRRGHVYAFDIQHEALELTKERIERELTKQQADQKPALAEVSLLKCSHADMLTELPERLQGKIGAMMFNLGYLPTEQSDRSIMTEAGSTLMALDASITMLRPKGIVTIVLYPGHSGGDTEAAAVQQWAESVPSSVGQTICYRQIQKPAAPYLIAIEKR